MTLSMPDSWSPDFYTRYQFEHRYVLTTYRTKGNGTLLVPPEIYTSDTNAFQDVITIICILLVLSSRAAPTRSISCWTAHHAGGMAGARGNIHSNSIAGCVHCHGHWKQGTCALRSRHWRLSHPLKPVIQWVPLQGPSGGGVKNLVLLRERMTQP